MPDLTIVPYKTKTARKARRGHKAIAAGTDVYLIQGENEKFFAFCYLQEADAKQAMKNLQASWNDTTDSFNFYNNAEQCLHVEKLYGVKS